MTDETALTGSRQQLFDALLQLGFSQYEAKCYVGLIGTDGLTGYGVAKATGVPQPKVYETLRRLVRRGVAQQIADDPAVFAATAPDQVLEDLAREFRRSHESAAQAAKTIHHDDHTSPAVQVRGFRTADRVMAAARSLIEGAERRVYLSTSSDELDALIPSLRDAVARGVDVILLDFGAAGRQEAGMRIFRHASTDRAIYRHHQARHLALVVDSLEAVTAVAVDGEAWEGVQSGNTAIIAAVKGMIRHDIDLQQVYADFGPTLVEAYGPGLQALETYRAPVPETTETAAPVPVERRSAKRRA